MVLNNEFLIVYISLVDCLSIQTSQNFEKRVPDIINNEFHSSCSSKKSVRSLKDYIEKSYN